MPNLYDDLIEDTSLVETEIFDTCFLDSFLNLNFFHICASVCFAAICSLATPKSVQASTLTTTSCSTTMAKIVINVKQKEPFSNKKVFVARRTEPIAVRAFAKPVGLKSFHSTPRKLQTTTRRFNRSVVRKNNSIRASLSKEEILVIALRMIPTVASNLVNLSTKYGPHVSVFESAVNLAMMGTNYIKNQMQKDNQPLPPGAEAILFTELKEALMPLIDDAKDQFKKESDAKLDLIADAKTQQKKESDARIKAIEEESNSKQVRKDKESAARINRKNEKHTANQARKQELHNAKLKKLED